MVTATVTGADGRVLAAASVTAQVNDTDAE
jgi:hypothetical protein